MKRRLVAGAVATGTLVSLIFAPMPGIAQAPKGPIERGALTFTSQGCHGCHLVGKFGTPIGPDLTHIGSRYRASYLASWLRDPQSVRPAAHMPKLELTGEDVEALAAYLGSLK